MASAAPELVNLPALAGDRDQLGSVAVGDPAPGTKHFTPERLAEIQTALKRQARLIGYGFLLLHLKAKARLAFLRFSLTILEGRSNLKRRLNELVARAGHRNPLR